MPFTLNQRKMHVILSNRRYGSEALRVMLFMMAAVEFDNRVFSYTQGEIAKIIGMQQSQVGRAVRKLVEGGVIEKRGRDYYFSDDLIVQDGKAKYRCKREPDPDKDIYAVLEKIASGLNWDEENNRLMQSDE